MDGEEVGAWCKKGGEMITNLMRPLPAKAI